MQNSVRDAFMRKSRRQPSAFSSLYGSLQVFGMIRVFGILEYLAKNIVMAGFRWNHDIREVGLQ
ncbi:hypothetical protein D3C85_1715810 [compost metagenome]